MNFIKIFSVILALFFISGCSSKNYYEPNDIADSVNFNDGSIDNIIKTNRNIMQLEDGSLVTDRVIKFKLKENEMVLNYDKTTKQVSTLSNDFTLKIYSEKGEVLFSKKFDEKIVVATMKDDIVALVTATNKVIILNSSEITFSQKFDKAYSITSRIASPIFSKDVAAVPTLDGRVILVRANGQLIQNIPISSQKNFNNVIFLEGVEESIIAVTPSKAISIKGKINILKEHIKDVIVVHNNLYFFTNDGQIIKTDSDLNKLATKKYKFAIFSRAGSDGEYIYALEKTGYLIVTDLDLSKDLVYETSDIDTYTFINDKNIFYDNDYLNIQNIMKP